MTKTKRVFIKGLAYEYGVNAFHKGIKCAPALDQKFCEDFLTGVPVGDTFTVKYMKEWTKGWTESNLKAEY